MTIEVRVDREAGVVRLRASGQLALRDLLDSIDAMLTHPEFEREMPQLVDLGAVEHTELTADEMRVLIEAFAKERPRVESPRVAVFAPTPLLFGVSRMYESLAERIPSDLRVFRDLGDAEAWLRGEEPGD